MLRKAVFLFFGQRSKNSNLYYMGFLFGIFIYFYFLLIIPYIVCSIIVNMQLRYIQSLLLRNSGFSIFELSVVLVVVAAISGISLTAGKTTMDVSDIRNTKTKLGLIKESLNLYKNKHGLYPCPAIATETKADANYGKEEVDCTSVNSHITGAVPFKTLGMNEDSSYDSWNNKIAYTVDIAFTEISPSTQGRISIQDRGGSEITASPIFGKATFALISYGPNSNGAYSRTGTINNACDNNLSDSENCDNDGTFMDARTTSGDITANFNDDLISWETENHIPPAPPASALPDERLAVGLGHACIIANDAEDGEIWCWGYNASGQTGGGDYDLVEYAPVKAIGISNVTQLHAGGAHTCALKTDTSVWCWGANQYGQSGLGAAMARIHSPTAVPGMTGVAKIFGGHWATCALKIDGSVWCWGIGLDGIRPKAWTALYTPTLLAAVTDAKTIAMGWYHFCYTKNADGSVWCWGDNQYGQMGNAMNPVEPVPVQISGLSNVTGLTAGSGHVCALKNDNTVECWGRGIDGELGNGANNNETAPVTVTGLGDAVKISAYSTHTCATRQDSSAVCWGAGDFGMLGNGDIVSQNTPVPVAGLVGLNQVKAGAWSTCAEKADDTFWCWGGGMFAKLGDGDTDDELTPVQVQGLP